MSSFYEFYKKVCQEKRIREQNNPAMPQMAPPGGQQMQQQGQGTAPPANDKAVEEIKKMWPQIQKIVPQIQDPNLKKAFEELSKNPLLSAQGQQAPAAPKPMAPRPATPQGNQTPPVPPPQPNQPPQQPAAQQ